MHLILIDITNMSCSFIPILETKFSPYRQNISILLTINYILVKTHGTLLSMVQSKKSLFLSVMELTELSNSKTYTKMT